MNIRPDILEKMQRLTNLKAKQESQQKPSFMEKVVVGWKGVTKSGRLWLLSRSVSQLKSDEHYHAIRVENGVKTGICYQVIYANEERALEVKAQYFADGWVLAGPAEGYPARDSMY